VESASPLGVPRRPARPLTTLQLFKIAQTNSLAAWDEELFDELFVERRYFWGRLFVVSDPDGIRRVLQDNHSNYPRLATIRRLFEFTSGTSIFCTEGEAWRRHRRLITPALDANAVAEDTVLLVRAAEEMAAAFAAHPAGQEFDIGRALGLLVIRSARYVFATDNDEIEPMLDHMAHYPLQPSLLHFVRLPDWLPFAKRYNTSRAEAETFQPMLDRLIAERRSPGYAGRHDLIWRLAEARDRDGGGLGTAELRDEIIALGATSYTVLRPLTWVWYLLALHPRAEERLHAELADVLGGAAPTAENLANLVYLRQLLDETMRLYPPLPVLILRTAERDDTVSGRRIPRNSIVAIMPWVLHRHRKLWQDPDRFDPERFSPQNSAGRPRYSYLPFAIGPHVCIGASLVMRQMLSAVAVLAQRFRFRLVPGQRIDPIAWINLRPSRGIMMTLEPRLPAARTG